MENMIDRKSIKKIDLEFTEKEVQELREAKEKPISFDPDCPETTPERALKFKRVNPPRRVAGQS